MASKVIFPALLFLSILASSSMAARQHGFATYSPGEDCYQPWGYPSFNYPLQGCRAVARSQCLGVPVAENVKAACCRQLDAINNGFCKCPALGKMLGIMYKELGVTAAAGKQAEVFPGCRTEAMQRAAASIPVFCKQDIPIGVGGVCYWVDYPIN